MGFGTAGAVLSHTTSRNSWSFHFNDFNVGDSLCTHTDAIFLVRARRRRRHADRNVQIRSQASHFSLGWAFIDPISVGTSLQVSCRASRSRLRRRSTRPGQRGRRPYTSTTVRKCHMRTGTQTAGVSRLVRGITSLVIRCVDREWVLRRSECRQALSCHVIKCVLGGLSHLDACDCMGLSHLDT